MALVAFGVAIEFCQPPFTAVCGGCAVFATLVAMPEAAMNKNHGFVFRQNDIGTAGQFPVMQPEAIAHAVQERPDNHLRLGILTGDAAHVPASAGRCQQIFADSFGF